MQIEVIIVAVIVFGIMTITGQISMNQLISDNQLLFLKIKEKDWDFLVRAKYGTNVNPDILFNKRIKNALITMAIAFAIMIKDLNAVKNEMDFLKFLRILASRTGQMLNYTDIANEVSIAVNTIKDNNTFFILTFTPYTSGKSPLTSATSLQSR